MSVLQMRLQQQTNYTAALFSLRYSKAGRKIKTIFWNYSREIYQHFYINENYTD